MTALGRVHTICQHLQQAEPVHFDLTDGIATITMNCADNGNSMTPILLDAFSECMARCKDDNHVRCIIITGNGDSFCRGANFKDLPGASAAVLYNTIGRFLSLLDVRVPVIAAMNGHATGGGLGLALVCDIRIASETAEYGFDFVRLGLHPGAATTNILPRLVGFPRACELIYTGRNISGAEAARLGLVNYAVPKTDVLNKAMELAREISNAQPLAVKWAKDMMIDQVDGSTMTEVFERLRKQHVV